MAKRLATGLSELSGVRSPGDIAQLDDGPLDPARVRTNFVLFRVADRDSLMAAAARHGLLLDAFPHGQVRAVTHYGVGKRDVDDVLAIIRGALAETA